MVSIDVLFETVTAVGAPLVKVAVPSGTTGVELQLVPVVHSLPGPTQMSHLSARPPRVPDGRLRLDSLCPRARQKDVVTLPIGTWAHRPMEKHPEQWH